MHEVELVAAVAQRAVDPLAERVRLGEPGRAHDRDLLEVDERAQLVRPRRAERVLAAVEVEARHLLERDRVVDHRPRLAGEHRRPGARAWRARASGGGCRPLAAAVRVAPVDQEGDAEGVAGARHGNGGRSHEARQNAGSRVKQWGRAPCPPGIPAGRRPARGTAEAGRSRPPGRRITYIPAMSQRQ